MASEKGLGVDEDAFNTLMQMQRERARASRSTGAQGAQMVLIWWRRACGRICGLLENVL